MLELDILNSSMIVGFQSLALRLVRCPAAEPKSRNTGTLEILESYNPGTLKWNTATLEPWNAYAGVVGRWTLACNPESLEPLNPLPVLPIQGDSLLNRNISHRFFLVEPRKKPEQTPGNVERRNSWKCWAPGRFGTLGTLQLWKDS